MGSAVPASALQMETEKKSPNEMVVRCTGRIVSTTTPSLRETVRPLIPGNKSIVLDLTNVGYLDSSGLGSIVELWSSGKKNSCDLKLTKANDRIKELLRLSNLTMLLGE
jgi:anti-sigma B factor antagonist